MRMDEVKSFIQKCYVLEVIKVVSFSIRNDHFIIIASGCVVIIPLKFTFSKVRGMLIAIVNLRGNCILFN